MIEEQKASILIVDDELSNLNVLAEILKNKYKIILSKNGKQALELAIKQPPDLVLLDIIIPDMNGYEILYAFKNNNLLKDIPVIFITALSNDADEEKGLLLGAVDYISKPFTPSIVKARVNNHMKIVRQRKLIESIAMLDSLTEIPNRRNYNSRIEMEWNRAVREKTVLSLLIIDIDCFKGLNDQYGHSKGDEALKMVAHTIFNMINRPADFAARIGGEEFAVLLPNTPAEGARQKAELIRAAIQSLGISHHYSPVCSVLTVSIGGTSCWPNNENHLEDFINAADKLMYKAKKEGRNKVVWG
ncbi:MAG: diguanylate cyclase [Syntrophomonadaceae bacterium]|nr:diguanylate cyclase [Syntrophomonadaceae bacterium]MDD3023306.1 diguanylate cyclase [Syntrophomonadaceae bacterium]